MLRIQFIYYVLAFLSNASQLIQLIKSFFVNKKFIFENFIFPKFCLILFDFCFRNFFVINSVHEQCPISDSETVLSQKLAKCTMCTATAQPARTGCPQAARAWSCRGQPSAVSWPRPWPCRSPRLPCCSAARPCSPTCRAPRACVSCPVRLRLPLRSQPPLPQFSSAPNFFFFRFSSFFSFSIFFFYF